MLIQSTRARGQLIEDFASQYLVSQGLNVLHRNFRCNLGEIDIICETECERFYIQTLVFVEVRFRKNKHFGGPLASIDWRKQQKLIRTAHFFLKTHPGYLKTSCRFDVLAVTLRQASAGNFDPLMDKSLLDELTENTLEIEWIKNAFVVH